MEGFAYSISDVLTARAILAIAEEYQCDIAKFGVGIAPLLLLTEDQERELLAAPSAGLKLALLTLTVTHQFRVYVVKAGEYREDLISN